MAFHQRKVMNIHSSIEDTNMLQRDYIMRLVREFAEALELVLRGRDIDKHRDELRHLYEQYVGPYDFYSTAAIEDVMASFEQIKPEERMERMEMLADLYYAEADTTSGPIRHMLMEKAFRLFSFIDAHSRTFSLLRQAKIADLRGRMSQQASSSHNQGTR